MSRILSLLLFCFIPLMAFTQLNKLKALPENTWMIVDTTGIQFHGHTAFSGGTYDRTNHQILVFGGGHADGFYNDVLAFDISSMTWKSMYTTDSLSDYTCGNVSASTPGMLLSSGLPASRHTYDQIDFIGHLGKMIMWSGPTWGNSGIPLWSCPGGQTLPADTWLYDWAANKWAYKNASRQAQPTGESGRGEYDPIGKLYYAMDRDNYYYPQFWSYNPDTDVWTKLAKFSDSASSAVQPPNNGTMLTADKKRQRLWVWPYYYDIKTKTWGKSNAAGAPSSTTKFSESGVSMAYDEINDVMITFSGTSIYVYHIAQDQWETLSAANFPSVPTYVFGRFFFDPVDNVFMMVSPVGNRAQTWAYRYKGTSGSAVQIGSPVRAISTAITASPNPFTCGTKIHVPEPVVALKLYNAQGRLVKSLKTNSSAMEYAWDGRDNAGNPLPNGLYVARFTGATRTASGSILLAR